MRVARAALLVALAGVATLGVQRSQARIVEKRVARSVFAVQVWRLGGLRGALKTWIDTKDSQALWVGEPAGLWASVVTVKVSANTQTYTFRVRLKPTAIEAVSPEAKDLVTQLRKSLQK